MPLVTALSQVPSPRLQGQEPEPRRAREATSVFSRYVGGTYPSTVERIRFADGATARTDLVRLHPNIAAYSIDLDGIAPRHPSRYRDEPWSGGSSFGDVEGEVVWILRHSYPTLGTAELSRHLRDAHVPIGEADLKEHEAIAGTQAAIWYLTNGVALDTQPLSVPIAVAVDRSVASTPAALVDGDARTSWRGLLDPSNETGIEFTFDGSPELRDFTVELGPRTTARVVAWRLQRSSDRREWHDVSSSRVEIAVHDLTGDRGSTHTKALGVGATVSTASASTGSAGFRHYRLVLQGHDPAVEQIEIRSVRFTLAGTPEFRNDARVVHLYRYLLDHSCATALGLVRVALRGPVTAHRVRSGGLVGPFHVEGDQPARVSVTGGAAVVDEHGAPVCGPVSPARPFYVTLDPSDRGRSDGDVAAAFRIQAVVGPVQGYEGRAIVGARTDQGPAEFTTLARAVPALRHAVATLEVGLGDQADVGRPGRPRPNATGRSFASTARGQGAPVA